jgi:hypothetical protein
MRVLAIDPGSTKSGVCMIHKNNYFPVNADKITNEDVLQIVPEQTCRVVIEMVASYGMPVDVEVFETCVWIGRFIQHFEGCGCTVERIVRKDVKLHLCSTLRAKDSNVRQALIDRFAPGVNNYGKGTKKQPGWFYGFSADVWQAYALGVTYIDRMRKETEWQ